VFTHLDFLLFCEAFFNKKGDFFGQPSHGNGDVLAPVKGQNGQAAANERRSD
jgi:hypothetical protein